MTAFFKKDQQISHHSHAAFLSLRMVHIRPATLADAPYMLSIYAPFILDTAVSFETEVPDEASFSARISKGILQFPWLVCETGEQLAGYAYASLHRERPAYQWTCEVSVYLSADFRKRGVGTALYTAILAILRFQGYRNVYAGITLPNEASVRLHEHCGFARFATYEKIGNKFGAWHDVGWWRLRLNEFEPEPPPPVAFSRIDGGTFISLVQPALDRLRSGLND
jgi:L-amino acid N-acyltransferase YncA